MTFESLLVCMQLFSNLTDRAQTALLNMLEDSDWTPNESVAIELKEFLELEELLPFNEVNGLLERL